MALQGGAGCTEHVRPPDGQVATPGAEPQARAGRRRTARTSGADPCGAQAQEVWLTAVEAAYLPLLELRHVDPARRNASTDRAVRRHFEAVDGAGLSTDDPLWREAVGLVVAYFNGAPRPTWLPTVPPLCAATRTLLERDRDRRPGGARPLPDDPSERLNAMRHLGAAFDQGFAAFAALGPADPRVRRALTMYYRPKVSCGLTPVVGALDVREPILVLSAEQAPRQLVRIYTLLATNGARVMKFDFGRPRLVGHQGEHGSPVRLIAVLVDRAAGVRAPLAALAKREARRKALPTSMRADWRTIESFLAAGVSGRIDASVLVTRLTRRGPEQRWALGWLGAPGGPDSRAIRRAIATAAASATDPEALFTALDAIGAHASPNAIATVARAARVRDPIVRDHAVMTVGSYLALISGPKPPTTLSAAQLRTLRAAFYPLLKESWRAQILVPFFSAASDPKLDAHLAKIIRTMRPADTSLMQTIAATAMSFPKLGWTKVTAAFAARGRDAGFDQAEYSARLARDLSHELPRRR